MLRNRSPNWNRTNDPLINSPVTAAIATATAVSLDYRVITVQMNFNDKSLFLSHFTGALEGESREPILDYQQKFAVASSQTLHRRFSSVHRAEIDGLRALLLGFCKWRHGAKSSQSTSFILKGIIS